MRRLTLLSGVAAVAAVTVMASGLSAGALRPPPFAQVGNYRAAPAMQLRDTRALADNKVGTLFGGYYEGGVPQGHDPDSGNLIYPFGFKWVELVSGDTLNWQSVERTPGVYSIDPGADRVISHYAAEGTNPILEMGVGEDPSRPTLNTPEQVDGYLAYVRVMVAHFKDRVDYFEILNEPNTMLTAAQYIDIVGRAIPLIRAEDLAAKIVIGNVAGPWEHGYPGYGDHGRYTVDLAFLKAVFGSRVAPLVDVLAWHPMFGDRADDPYYRTYPRTVAQLERVARANGFTGQFMASSMQWRTPSDPIDPLYPRYSEAVADKYLLRTTVLHRGLGLITIIAPPLPAPTNPISPTSKVLRANNKILAGATPGRLRATISTRARPLRSYGFVRPNGERLLALWTDGLPGNRQPGPGTSATLTFPGQAGHRATVLDPLRRRQQTLVTTNKNGNLVLRGFLVRDYPLFVRLR